MKTRWLLNIFLLLVVIILVAAVYYSGDTQQQKFAITTIDKQSIHTITIPREQGDIRLRKQETDWIMESPYQLPAHAFRINSLLNLLSATVDKAYAVDDLELTQFGLTPPRAIIHFDNTEIRFGKINPVNLQRYIQVGKKLFLINDKLFPLISSQPSSFVDLSPLPHNINIHKISLPEFSVFRNEQGLWQASKADYNHADRIQQLIENWQLAQAFGVHAYMQRTPLDTITIEYAEGRLQLDITGYEPWLILARPDAGVEYHFDTNLKTKLLQLPELTTVEKQ